MGFDTQKYQEFSNILQEFMGAVRSSVFWKIWLTNCMSKFSIGACFNSVIAKKEKKEVFTAVLHCIGMYFIPHFPKLIFLRFFLSSSEYCCKKKL